MSLLHFVTGKGGTGKSTFAASLVQTLAERREGPVLLIEVQGSGRSLEMIGLKNPAFNNTPTPEHFETFGARIFPRETFRQYFSLLLALGKENSTWGSATSAIRDKVVDMVFENKVVSSFIETCPGLEPAVLLGKLHWESTRGRAPEINKPWAHVVVDAPATGHGVMLFKSAFALTEVFSSGIISNQAGEIKSFVTNPQTCRVYITSTAEELPLAESVELYKKFKEMTIPVHSVIINRMKSLDENQTTATPPNLSAEWQREYEFEKESVKEEKELVKHFLEQIPADIKRIKVPEIYAAQPKQMLPQISKIVGGVL